MKMAMENGTKQAWLGEIGNTSVYSIEPKNSNEFFVITNSEVFKHFDFSQEFSNESEAWDRARKIDSFEKHFRHAIRCFIDSDKKHIYLDTPTEVFCYWINSGRLYGGTPTIIPNGRVDIYILPNETNNCRNRINWLADQSRMLIHKVEETLGEDMTPTIILIDKRSYIPARKTNLLTIYARNKQVIVYERIDGSYHLIGVAVEKPNENNLVVIEEKEAFASTCNMEQLRIATEYRDYLINTYIKEGK